MSEPAAAFPGLRRGTTPACKVCGAATAFFGAKDFNRSCEEVNGLTLPPLGVAVDYHRCGRCGLIFTDAFDDWTPEEFAAHIYGEGYAAVDPQFEAERPANMAAFVIEYFQHAKAWRILDYGGGNGRFAEALRSAGFTDVTTYDRFNAPFQTRPDGRFNLVTCFETLEHMPDPKAGAADLASLATRKGLILTATLIQPKDIEQVGVEWWYIAPRNGHVTLHTRASLRTMWARQKLQFASFTDNLHFAGREPPAMLGRARPVG